MKIQQAAVFTSARILSPNTQSNGCHFFHHWSPRLDFYFEIKPVLGLTSTSLLYQRFQPKRFINSKIWPKSMKHRYIWHVDGSLEKIGKVMHDWINLSIRHSRFPQLIQFLWSANLGLWNENLCEKLNRIESNATTHWTRWFRTMAWKLRSKVLRTRRATHIFF